MGGFNIATRTSTYHLLGPCNDALENLEEKVPLEMKSFHLIDCPNKTGEGPGGKLGGPSIKTVFKNLKDLEMQFPELASPFLNNFESMKSLHKMCL